MIRAKNCNSIQIHCCLNVGGGRAEVFCNDPKCDGRVVLVDGEWEIACHRFDGLPHPIGIPRGTQEPTRASSPAPKPIRRTIWQRFSAWLFDGGRDE